MPRLADIDSGQTPETEGEVIVRFRPVHPPPTPTPGSMELRQVGIFHPDEVKLGIARRGPLADSSGKKSNAQQHCSQYPTMMMSMGHLVLGALSLLILAGTVEAQNVYIWAGLKTHGEGQHDYPQFLADWSKILTERGAVVSGGLHPPGNSDIEKADVIVIYKGDAGFLTDGQKATLDAFVKRGGGLVSLHDSLCGPDPVYMSGLVGGAKKHGEVNYTLDAAIPYTVVDKANPIVKDLSDIALFDEAFFSMTWAREPAIKVLANAVIPATRSAGTHKGEVVPQIWTYEHTVPGGQPARAFVWMQGHTYANFANYQMRRTLLRGIAWAAKKPVDQLIDYVAPPRPNRTGLPSSPAR